MGLTLRQRDIENMKYFEEVRTTYKTNLITSGRHYVQDGRGWVRQESASKFQRGQYYVFTDLFAFGKGNKLFTISLKNAVLLGPHKYREQGKCIPLEWHRGLILSQRRTSLLLKSNRESTVSMQASRVKLS
jgi:hypothetical protein